MRKGAKGQRGKGSEGVREGARLSLFAPSFLVTACLFFLLTPVAAAAFFQQQSSRELSKQAAELYNSAVDAFRAGDLDRAIAHLREADRAQPDHPDIRLYLGLFLYEKTNDSPEAQGLLESALAVYPAHPDLPLKLMNSYLLTGRRDKAQTLLETARPRMESDPRFAFNLIYTLLYRGDPHVAKNELDAHSKRLQGEVQFLGGLIAAKSGRPEEAAALLQAARQNGFPPAGSRQVAVLADALFQLNQFKPASEAYEAYLQQFGPDENVLFRAGLSYYAFGDFRRARESFEGLLHRKPQTPEANYYLGSVLVEMKQMDEAEKHLQAELAIDPRSYRAMTKIAYLRYLGGDHEQCVNWLEKSLALNPNWFEAHFVRGLLHGRLGEYEAATESFGRVIAEEPGYPKAYYHLAMAYKRLGQEDKAAEALQAHERLQSDQTARSLEALGMADQPIAERQEP
jgi:tetratricopeptide (TPR) repeat protein